MAGEPAGEAQSAKAPAAQAGAQQADGPGVLGAQKAHGRPGPGAKAFTAPLDKYAAQAGGHLAKVDVDRAGCLALVADGAVVGQVVHLREVAAG